MQEIDFLVQNNIDEAVVYNLYIKQPLNCFIKIRSEKIVQ